MGEAAAPAARGSGAGQDSAGWLEGRWDSGVYEHRWDAEGILFRRKGCPGSVQRAADLWEMEEKVLAGLAAGNGVPS